MQSFDLQKGKWMYIILRTPMIFFFSRISLLTKVVNVLSFFFFFKDKECCLKKSIKRGLSYLVGRRHWPTPGTGSCRERRPQTHLQAASRFCGFRSQRGCSRTEGWEGGSKDGRGLTDRVSVWQKWKGKNFMLEPGKGGLWQITEDPWTMWKVGVPTPHSWKSPCNFWHPQT